MALWHLGNTTVRSPFRLRDGLVALAESGLEGHIRGRDGDVAFRELLGAKGIVELGTDKTHSVGRKWRSALTKLGFLVPALPPSLAHLHRELGPTDTITENGRRLIGATTVAGMQECFLRSLAAHLIPDPLESEPVKPFSPLRYTLAVMVALRNLAGESHLSFMEMALVVQTATPPDSPSRIAEQILALRVSREKAANKKRFDEQQIHKLVSAQSYVPTTYRDYADTNFRYLKATGLVLSKGRGVTLRGERASLVDLLASETPSPPAPEEYVRTLCRGASLPTDDKTNARRILEDLAAQLSNRGIAFNIETRALGTTASLNVARHEAEQLLDESNEERFALDQPQQHAEIEELIGLFERKENKKMLAGGNTIQFPKNEAPAYLEWTIWRAFLAINHLRNEPSKARRFAVDQDFLPIGTAPGNGPDMLFEFEDFVLVVEVTLTENSRQEAAEGETVRRHVANVAEEYAGRKPVFGLFLAHRVDTNTAETFRVGSWYSRDDRRALLNILPITIGQFRVLFRALFEARNPRPHQLRELIERCGVDRSSRDAPEWKRTIADGVREFAARYGIHG